MGQGKQRTEAFAAPGEASQEGQPDFVPQPVEEFVANVDTMTVAGVTLGALIEKAQSEIEELTSQVGVLAADNAAKAKTIADLNTDLAVARLVAKDAKTVASAMPAGIQRTPDGGLRLMIRLDVDEATPLLSWADSAGEDPAEYIAKTLKDALVAVTCS